MKIFVKAKANAKENKIIPPLPKLFKTEDRKEDYFTVLVKEPPFGGRANNAIIKMLSQYFKISKSGVHLVSGSTSKNKVFEILNK